MAGKIEEKLTKKEIEKLLKEQTRVILDAVDERVLGLEKKIAKLEIKMERRFDQLITTLDKFLKRLTDLEDEFTIMKTKIRKIEEVLKEKLGVEID
jgi:predicted  nucleic acid-binding Zn-ribbon protein